MSPLTTEPCCVSSPLTDCSICSKYPELWAAYVTDNRARILPPLLNYNTTNHSLSLSDRLLPRKISFHCSILRTHACTHTRTHARTRTHERARQSPSLFGFAASRHSLPAQRHAVVFVGLPLRLAHHTPMQTNGTVFGLEDFELPGA